MFGRNRVVVRNRIQKWFIQHFFRISILLIGVFLMSGFLVINALADHALYALEFDGVGEYIQLGDTGELMGEADWASGKTVSLWIKPGTNAAPASPPTNGELILGVDYPSLFAITRANFNGQDRIWVWNADVNGVDIVGIPYTPGEWMHVALVHTNGVLYAFQNGQLAGSTGSGTTYTPGNGRLFIGGSGRSNASRYFEGQIDEVRIWNVGVGAAEIGSWWDQELTTGHPNWGSLAAYYKMSDGAGVVLTDDSGNGHTGDLTGGMGDENWVTSGALGDAGTTPTVTPLPSFTPTPTAIPPTATPVPPTETPLPTFTPTATALPPTATPVGPTATPAPPTETPLPSFTPTATAIPPTATPVGPTATPVPPTETPLPSFTPTATAIPPTSTPVEPPVNGSGYALEFDGVGEYIRLGDTGDLMGEADWASGKTISMWIKPGTSAAPASPPTNGELILGVDYPSLFAITRANFNGQDRIWIWNADVNGVDLVDIPYTPDEWMHVALVHSDGVLYAYQNGELAGAIGSGTTYTPGNGRLFIGGSGRSSTSRYFEGQIDEVRIWNVGLGAAEISSWWDQELTTGHPNWGSLAAYYKMSDGAGVVLTDDSGNGHTGDLTGGMGDENWVASGALGDTGTTPTVTPLPSFTPTPTAIPPTATPVPPTETPLPSFTPTATALPPTATPVGPTATPLPPTETPLPSFTPTATAIPPTATATPLPTFTPTPGTGSGFALEFDGNSDFVRLVETSYIMSPGWEDTKTVSLWVKPVGAGEECRYNSVPFCDTILGDRPKWWGITRGVLGGEDKIWIWNFDGSSGSMFDTIGIDYTPDEWVHISLVHNNGIIRVYKNGVEVGNTPSGTTVQPNTGGLPVLHLGGIIINSNSNSTFRGAIDEVQLWNTARTSSQIAGDMYQILSGSETGLKAYYRMSDGSGLTLSDDSIYDWDGTLYDGYRDVPPDGYPPQWISPGPF